MLSDYINAEIKIVSVNQKKDPYTVVNGLEVTKLLVHILSACSSLKHIL